MKVNTQCVLKYLKHDYKEIAINFACLVGAIAAVLAIAFICLNGPSLVWPYISSYYTAYNILNGIVGVIVILFTFGIAVLYNKESFFGKTYSEYDETPITVEHGSGDYIAIASFCAGMVYLIYIFGAWMITTNPDIPIYSMVIFVASILIGTPIGCAIARCKEE
jgi:ABC-type arginine transport system permease subunit